MVYVDSDGTVYQERPWSVGKVMSILWGITNLIIAFFQTLIPGLMDNNKGSSNGFRSGGPSRGGSGGGNGGGGGGGGRRPPRPPGPGNIHGLSSLPKAPNPPPACGSCCGR
ncbi:hypothetical protein O3M35_012809 [Rhynocoris fuscipes]|uniref:Selenoprotein K n=1 Tax=Rhynocoris fuscipes TaxID=488301 RepID=A0AAW1CGI0_9HEMI